MASAAADDLAGIPLFDAAAPSRVLVLFGTEFRQLQQRYPELASRIESGLREIARPA